MDCPPNTVIVTGFGPYQNNKINSSWEIAKELTKMRFDLCGINLVVQEIPVEYATVSKSVPIMWEEYAPKLVVHMGLAPLTREIKIESTAHKFGYCKPDNKGVCPVGGSCNGRDDVLCTQLDLVRVIEKVHQVPGIRIKVELSSNAGRYVCEFTYYTSLNINNYRTVFVHVPDIDKPYSVKELAECVKYIILFLYEETVKNSESPKTKM